MLDDLLTDAELDEILAYNKIEVCGWYMGDFYEKPTMVVADIQIGRLVQEHRYFKRRAESKR